MLTELDEYASAAYEIEGRRFDVGAAGFVEAIARAHAMQLRPRCMCQPEGIETYVARMNGSYVVKRMPETGSQHAASCPHFETSADANGFGPLMGTAILEDPATGLTALRVDFSMSRSPPRDAANSTSTRTQATARSGARLSLHELLLYLWQEAGLNRWQPGFAGKRNWATVRRRLLQAAAGKLVGRRPLLERLFVPESFAVERRDEIARRRTAAWANVGSSTAALSPFLLLIGELKEIAPARCGFKAVIRHMPDQKFMLDERLYGQISRRLQPALALWNAADDVHMMVIATFAMNPTGVPTMSELALMPTTREWLPIGNAHERELVGRLVEECRGFVKHSRIGSRGAEPGACATLTDCAGPDHELYVVMNADLRGADGPSTTRWSGRDRPT